MAKDANKERAMAALLEADTFTSAAAMAGISRRTLYGYLYDDKDFAQEYRHKCRLKSIERAEAATGERAAAIDAIKRIMNDDGLPAAVRLKAAQVLLERADAACIEETVTAQAALDSHSNWFTMD